MQIQENVIKSKFYHVLGTCFMNLCVNEVLFRRTQNIDISLAAMVLVLDGNTDKGAHVREEIKNLKCVMHLNRLKSQI